MKLLQVLKDCADVIAPVRSDLFQDLADIAGGFQSCMPSLLVFTRDCYCSPIRT
jgi:hypothetical protein